MSFTKSLSIEEKAMIVLNFHVPVQHLLLICIFVSPCFPNWEHVLRALETFISFGVSFSSFFLSFTRRRVFGVSSESNKETNWIVNFLFLPSVVKTPPRVLGLFFFPPSPHSPRGSLRFAGSYCKLRGLSTQPLYSELIHYGRPSEPDNR